MSYDWRGNGRLRPGTIEWFDDQDRRSAEAHSHFATDSIPFDRIIPYSALQGKEVLEIGVGSGYHAELLARAGARITGIDITESAIAMTRERFRLKNLSGVFEQWDAETDRESFARRFDFIWSWGVIHHSSNTARIVRNTHLWLTSDGTFSGMVYHRDSLHFFAALLGDWFIHRNLLAHSVDEALWRYSDGFMARFYPADQWRDILLAFFEDAHVYITGLRSDVAPFPRAVRRLVEPMIPTRAKREILGKMGSFLVFEANRPMQSFAHLDLKTRG
jgi:2-polyprenyl-3-methyl-5-hydroxy-6-metoxy-1,4-benzoquinol methylase